MKTTTPLVVGLCALFTTWCTAGCASMGEKRVNVPGHERIYISVFVDESDDGEVGLAVAEAIQMEIYTRDPHTLAMQFEEGSAALDGTVVAVDDVVIDDDESEIRVHIRAVIVDKRGRQIADLGSVESRATYDRDGETATNLDPQKRSEARNNALARAIQSLAKHIVKEINVSGGRHADALIDAPRSRDDDRRSKGKGAHAFFFFDEPSFPDADLSDDGL